MKITAKKCIIGLVILLITSGMLIGCSRKEKPAESIQSDNEELIASLRAEIEAAQTELSELFARATAMLPDMEMWQQRLRGGRPERRERSVEETIDQEPTARSQDGEPAARAQNGGRGRRYPGSEALTELLEVLAESGQILEGEFAVLRTRLEEVSNRLEAAQAALLQALPSDQADE